MLRFVEELGDFLMTSKPTSDRTDEALGLVGAYRLRVICMALLGWMKRQHQSGQLKPLSVDRSEQWLVELETLMGQFESFRDLVQFTGSQLQFNPRIEEDNQKEICEIANRLYRPQLMT